MSISRTAQYIEEQNKTSYSPIVIVEVVGEDFFFASRDPGFVGQWLAGDGLVAGADVVAAANYPTYQTILQQISQGGVRPTNTEIQSDGLARTGNASFSVINPGLFNRMIREDGLTNAIMRIRLGFNGGTFQDFITMWQGVLNEWVADYNTVDFSGLDETLINTVNIPDQLAADIFPRSFTSGTSIPIYLGDVANVPFPQLIGDVSGTLGLDMSGASTTIEIFDSTLPFPERGGEVVVSGNAGFETLDYGLASTTVINGVPYLQLSELDRPFPMANPAGSLVTLTSVVYTYIVGLQPDHVRAIHTGSGAPTTAFVFRDIPVEANGSDPRIATTVEFSADQTEPFGTVASVFRAQNLIVNGEGDADPSTLGWTVVAGTWDNITVANQTVIRGRVLAAQGIPSEMFQDIATTTGGRYRITFTTYGGTAPFQSVRIGVAGNTNSVYDFGQIAFTTRQTFSLIFTAPAASTRITLLVDFTGVVGGFEEYFDDIEVYDVTSENPARQVSYLLATYGEGVQSDTTSFDDAIQRYDDSGDRLAGVLLESEELQGLLGRMAEQFRARTFLGEEGNQKWVVFDNSRPPILTVNETVVDKGSFRVTTEGTETIATRYFIYFDRNYLSGTSSTLGGRQAYNGLAFATPGNTSSLSDPDLGNLCEQAADTFGVTRTVELFADFIQNVETAELTLSHLVRLGTHRRLLVQFDTYLNLSHVEVADVIRIFHPLLPEFADGATYEVLSREFVPQSMVMRFTCAEIRQSAFNSFTETWEPQLSFIGSTVIDEFWEPPIEPSLAEGPCPSYTETWEPSASLFGGTLTFNRLLAAEPLSRTLVAAWVDSATSVAGPTIPNATLNASHVPVLTISPTVGGGPGTFDHFAFVRGTVGNDDKQITSGAFGNNQLFTDSGSRAGSLNWTRNVALSVWVYLQSKPTDSMGIIHLSGLDTQSTAEVQYVALWWDQPTDRFVVAAVQSDFTGGAVGQGFLTGLTDKVTASSFGAPSLATWYHIVVQWTVSGGTLSIQVNDGTVDSASVTSNFGGFSAVSRAHAKPLGSVGTHIAQARFGALNKLRTTGTERMDWNGRLSLPHLWATNLTGAEVTQMFNAGSGAAYPSF